MLRSATLLLLLPLAACNGGDGNSTVSIHAEGEGGNVSFTEDSSGRAEIKAPGLTLSAKLPKIQIDAADFDVNGMKLYPGSTIRDLNLNATEKAGAKDEAKMTITFDSPASLAKVQAWFRDTMAERGFKVTPRGNGFAGTTDEGDPIGVELEADGNEHSKGKMTVGG